jgi:cytochrome c biogenesis protein CcdA
MNFLQQLLDSTTAPVLTAFLLGLMTAISPCPLATNITAIGYISKDIKVRRKVFINGLLYTLGRAITYTALGVILYFGASKFQISRLFQANGGKILGPLLLIVGILMLDVIKFRLPGGGSLTDKISSKLKFDSGWSALLLGIVFAMAFCPYSGVLYFGMLIPIAITSASGLYLPLVFAIATGLPVIFVAWLLAYSISEIGVFYNRIKTFERWFRRIVAAIFILGGIYYLYVFYF